MFVFIVNLSEDKADNIISHCEKCSDEAIFHKIILKLFLSQ